jgi:energy-coupling factor transport system ATP-binding protein
MAAEAGIHTQEARPRELAGRVGLLFQDFEAQLFCTRVDQEVAFGPENLGLGREELKRRVARSLGLVGLTGLEADPATFPAATSFSDSPALNPGCWS